MLPELGEALAALLDLLLLLPALLNEGRPLPLPLLLQLLHLPPEICGMGTLPELPLLLLQLLPLQLLLMGPAGERAGSGTLPQPPHTWYSTWAGTGVPRATSWNWELLGHGLSHPLVPCASPEHPLEFLAVLLHLHGQVLLLLGHLLQPVLLQLLLQLSLLPCLLQLPPPPFPVCDLLVPLGPQSILPK